MIKFEHFTATAFVSNLTGEVVPLSPARNKVLLFLWNELHLTDNPVRKTMREVADMVGGDRKSVSKAVSALTYHEVVLLHEASRKDFCYYGVNETTLVLPTGHGCNTVLDAKVFELEEVKRVYNRGAGDGLYYVYMWKCENVPVYVGKGKDDRYKHVVSGASSNKNINKLLFEKGEEHFSVEFLKTGLTNEEALKAEGTTIRAMVLAGVPLLNGE